MNYRQILLFLLFMFCFNSCREIVNEEHIESSVVEQEDESIDLNQPFDYLPSSTTQSVYHHTAYSFSYHEAFEQAEWVAYTLEKDDMNNANYKRPYFNQDPMVKTESADWRNYKNSGYNKGHLCPAGDRKKNLDQYEETFFTSNISPQKYDFNSGVWNRLEQKVRYWAEKYDGIYVVTGGVLSDNLKTIGYEKVAVPNYFYKVLLTNDQKRMIAFLVPHKNSDKALYEFVVSVDDLEKMTGIDFFPQLEDSIENALEQKTTYKEWIF